MLEKFTGAIDWPALTLVPGSFIDYELRNSETDLLFTAPLRGFETPVSLYIRFEHQSTKDPAIALRLAGNMIRIWESQRRTTPDAPLSVILPVIPAQNARVWEMDTDFLSLFALPERLLPALSEPRLHAESASVFRLPWIHYLAASDLDRTVFLELIESLANPELHATARTLADQFREQGLEKGRQDAVIDNLAIRFEAVPAGLAEAIHQIGDLDRLRELQRASMTCATLEAFAATL